MAEHMTEAYNTTRSLTNLVVYTRAAHCHAHPKMTHTAG